MLLHFHDQRVLSAPVDFQQAGIFLQNFIHFALVVRFCANLKHIQQILITGQNVHVAIQHHQPLI